MAEYVELYIDQGADFSITIELNDDNTNLPQNTDGYIVTSQLRKSLLSANASANLECYVDDAANGIIRLSLDSANTANLRPGNYFFDVRTYYDDITSRLIEGVVFVTYGITK